MEKGFCDAVLLYSSINQKSVAYTGQPQKVEFSCLAGPTLVGKSNLNTTDARLGAEEQDSVRQCEVLQCPSFEDSRMGSQVL